MSTTLCVRCVQLPFKTLFWTSSFDGYGTGPIAQGYSDSYFPGMKCFAGFGEVWREEKCVFCALLRDTFKAFYSPEFVKEIVRLGDEAGFYLYQDPLDISLDRFAKAEGNIPLSLSVTVSRRHARNVKGALSTSSWPASDPRTTPQLIALHKGTFDVAHPCPELGRRVEINNVDWSIVRGWIDSCLKHPADDLMSGDDNASELRLRAVDVIDGCVVHLPPKAQYVALSYVWGQDQNIKLRKANLPQLSYKGYFYSASGRPSKTIVDAFRAVKSLGYRYIWVDALCIVQDDPISIQENVMQMDRVYACALFTIVAAAGKNANHGLPGASPDAPRTQLQHSVTINGYHIANRLRSDINGTWWNTRGWTYQERVLSKRLLFFSEVQVEFSCKGNCNFQEQFHDTNNRVLFFQFDSISHLDLTGTNLFAVYANAVTEYTRRSITNPMDKLKAFQGILSRLKAPFQGPFLFGLPVSLFDVGLLWYPIGSLTRGNNAFPSWSWAGWVGPVEWSMDGDKALINFCESTVSICTIRHNETGAHLCTNGPRNTDKPLGSNWKRHFDDDTEEIYYTSAHTEEIYYTSAEKSRRQYRYDRPLESDTSPSAHDGFIDAKSTVLEINGMMATMRLTGQHGAIIEQKCRQGIHEKCNLAILDDKNRVAGCVTVDGRLIPQLQGRTHQFLALSRSTYSRAGFEEELDENTAIGDIEPTWDRKTKRFRPWTDRYADSEKGQKAGAKRVFNEYERHFENWIAKPNSKEDDSVRSAPIPKDPVKGRQTQQFFLKRDHKPEWEMNRERFDKREFSDRTPWPRVNVLLLSPGKDGYVERLGCGEIHVDAFMPIAKSSTVLLR